MPGAFFRSVPCDLCGHSICLTLPWRILYLAINLTGVFLSYFAAESVSTLFFGNTLSVTLFVFILLMCVVELICRVILRFAKWKESNPAGDQAQSKQSLD